MRIVMNELLYGNVSHFVELNGGLTLTREKTLISFQFSRLDYILPLKYIFSYAERTHHTLTSHNSLTCSYVAFIHNNI